MASHSVHPTATTINFNIGMPNPSLGILSGPSNAGRRRFGPTDFSQSLAAAAN